MWLDNLHHELHVLLTGEREGYYERLRLARRARARADAARAGAARRLRRRTTTRSATARSVTGCPPDAHRVALAVVLFSLHTPLLFMGEEHDERAPVPVLHRPHRPGDRRRDARGTQARVRGVHGVLRRARCPIRRTRETFDALDRSRTREPDPLLRASCSQLRRDAAAASSTSRRRARVLTHAPRRRRRSSPTSTRRPWSCRRERRSGPGEPFPLGPSWDGEGTNFSLFSENAERVELCLFDERRQRGAHRGATSAPRSTGTATCPGVGPGQRYGYRVHGPYEPERGHALQPGEAADRPVREGDRRRGRLARREHAARTCPAGADDADLTIDDVRLGAARCRSASSIDPSFDWEDDELVRPRTPWNETVIYEAAREGLHEAARRRPRRSARHLRRPREPGRDRVPDVARRDGGRAAAGAPHHRRGLPRRPRADELLGLLEHRLPRAALALRRDRATRCASSRGWSRRCTAPGSR